MLLPTSELAVLLILALSVVAWGSWTSMFNVAKKWRFELFYYDFALGFALAAVLAAFTLGSWDSSDLTFQDNFLLAGRRSMVWVAGAGILLGIADLFLLAGATVSGTGVAFMLAFGVLVAINTVWELSVNTRLNLVLASSGAAMALVAVVLAALAYRWRLSDEEHEEEVALRTDPRAKKNVPPKPSTRSGPVLAVLAGIVLALFLRTLGNGITEDGGVGPYGALLLLSVGVVGTTIVFVPFFLYFPLRGGALQVRHYFKGNRKHHLLGLCGGALGGTAMLTLMMAKSAAAAVQPGPVPEYLLSYGAPVVAGIWGMFVWREFAGAVFRVNVMFFVSVVALLAALSLIGVSFL